MTTVTVAEAVTDPPAPLAVKIYVVELVGLTGWLPVLRTVPIPWLIDTLLASPLTCQRRVADWPR